MVRISIANSIFQVASLNVSLRQSGISRADLWALAGLVALERTLERANRACDLDSVSYTHLTLPTKA